MSDAAINIGALLKFSTLDYPGQLSAVIFCQGCPNHCVYCHNPEFIPYKSSSLVNFNEVFDFLSSRRGLLDAVVFSGGEPLVQDGLRDAMAQVKSLGYLIGLHTSGANPSKFHEVLPYIDWIGFDIKTVFDKYATITGQVNSEEKARESLDVLLSSNVKYEIRTTVDTRYISFDDLCSIAQMLSERGVIKWVLQECILRGDHDEHIALPSNDEIDRLREIIDIEIRKQ